MHINIKSHQDSLEKIERNGQIVKIIGKGLMKSPGHPAGHQIDYRQADIFNTSCKPPYMFTIYNDQKFLGRYSMLSYKIKLSFEGFRYYEFTLLRSSNSTLYVDLEVLDE